MPKPFPFWIPLGALVLAAAWLPTLRAPFDFVDDGNLVYPAPAGTTLLGHVELWYEKVLANYEHLGPVRPVLWAHWELAANLADGDPFLWRCFRLGFCCWSAGMLLWLFRELNLHPAAALVAAAAAMWNPYRNEIWSSLTLAEGVAMPYALLALVAARKAPTAARPWAWDAAAAFGLLMALGCKNTYAALVPAMIAVRVLPDGPAWKTALKSHAPRAAVYLLPLVLPAVHYVYFKLNWKPGQYETHPPTVAQALRELNALKGAVGLDFLGAGLALAVGAVVAARRTGGVSLAPYRGALVFAGVMLAAGFLAYLPMAMMSGRYTMPAVWGLNAAFGVLLSLLVVIPAAWPKRLAWAGVAVGVAALCVANAGKQEKFAARGRMLWQAVEVVEATAPPGAAVAWMSGDPAAGELGVEEGIHFRWHLLNRGRADVVVGLLDLSGNPVPRVELPPPPPVFVFRVSAGPPPAAWESAAEIVSPYWLGRKKYACHVGRRPAPAVATR